jgi:serine/threonine protein kinase
MSNQLYITGSIASAINYLHQNGIIHRDIKPENIVLDLVGRPYLLDFGISYMNSIWSHSQYADLRVPYLGPEVLAPNHIHSFEADFWSLGVVAFELFFNHRPFRRHCPKLWVEFVANMYPHHWTQQKSPKELTKPPFPILHVHLNPDGSRPPCLLVPFPDPLTTSEAAYDSNEVPIPSSEFKILLTDLLDVRVPQRLGKFSKFSEEFSLHPCFQRYDYHPDLMSAIPSPLMISLQSHTQSSQKKPTQPKNDRGIFEDISKHRGSDEKAENWSGCGIVTVYSREKEIETSSDVYPKTVTSL